MFPKFAGRKNLGEKLYNLEFGDGFLGTAAKA